MAQRFERLVQEDLNVGTDTIWVSAPGRGKLLSTQVGLHTVARGQQAYEASWTPGAIATTSKVSTTVTVPNATTGDVVLASHSKILTNDLRISGHVSAADTVKVVIHNPTSAAITVAAGVVRVIVFPFHGTGDQMTISAVGVQVEGGVAGEANAQFTYTVTGGTAPYTYSLSWTGGGGGGPALDADPLVVFTGTPGAPETIPWTVVVNDNLGATANDSGSVNVNYNS